LISSSTGDGSGRLSCYVGDSLLVFPSAVRGDGGSVFKRGDGDGRGNGGAFSGAATLASASFFKIGFLLS
jgi:hypothetical protein